MKTKTESSQQSNS